MCRPDALITNPPYPTIPLTAIILALSLAGAGCAAHPAPTPQSPRIDHVIILGIDGLSYESLATANVPHMRFVMENGAYTLNARTVLPTVSKPNWASMMMGASPVEHGVTTNAWRPDNPQIEPAAKGPGGIFPTIFGVLRQQRPAAKTAVFYEWGEMRYIFEPYAVDVLEPYTGAYMEQTEPSDKIMARALNHITHYKPALTYIDLDLVDYAGHHHGWNTPDYLQAVQDADSYVGCTLAAIKQAGIQNSTILFIVSDHGGMGESHGGYSRAEMLVPWMLIGPGVRPGHQISSRVNLYDTAPTVAHLLRLNPPNAWIGRPVLDALDGAPACPSAALRVQSPLHDP